MRRGRISLVALLALGLLTLAACGDDDDSGVSTDSSSTTADSAAGSTTTPTSEPCSFSGAEETVTGAAAGGTLFLTDVRAAGHECYDRVVLEFLPRAGEGDGTPGFTVGYEPGPILEDASGDPVEVAGSAYLVLRVSPATGYNFDTMQPSYDGSAAITPGDTAHVQEVVRSGDFEANLTWVVGLDEPRPFTVSTLTGPTRLVVDIG